MSERTERIAIRLAHILWEGHDNATRARIMKQAETLAPIVERMVETGVRDAASWLSHPGDQKHAINRATDAALRVLEQSHD